MEALELLGSRYIKPEQVAFGPVETLRAQNAATWRVVFIHRVSTTQGAAEQANLLKLLTTALVRSSEAKRLVLDFGEEQGFWNVVTESEPQCESLRDWLQAEVDASDKGEAILSAEQAAAMGEFARLFARGAKPPPRKAVPARAPKAATPPVQPPAEPVALPPVPVPPEPEPAPPVETAETAVPDEPAPPVEPPQLPVLTVVEEITPEPESSPQEPEISAQPDEDRPIVVPDEIPVIVISAPPPNKAMAATQSLGESKRPFEDANPSAPLPPRSFFPPRPPLPPPPVASTQVEPADDPPAAPMDSVTPEVVTELPKALADAPKVVPIDARPHEPRTETPNTDAIRIEEPPLVKAAVRGETAGRDDAPLFANSMPKASRLSKMAVFFIILGVAALLLVLVIVYLSTQT